MESSQPDPAHIGALRVASLALQGVLRAVLEVERRFERPASPLERMHRITTSPEWLWLQPLYRLIADIDHALAYADDLPASEAAAIGEQARTLLAGDGAPPEQAFLERYRALLQTDPSVAIAHGAALQALRRLPPEFESESERLHARHVWSERRKYFRERRERSD